MEVPGESLHALAAGTARGIGDAVVAEAWASARRLRRAARTLLASTVCSTGLAGARVRRIQSAPTNPSAKAQPKPPCSCIAPCGGSIADRSCCIASTCSGLVSRACIFSRAASMLLAGTPRFVRARMSSGVTLPSPSASSCSSVSSGRALFILAESAARGGGVCAVTRFPPHAPRIYFLITTTRHTDHCTSAGTLYLSRRKRSTGRSPSTYDMVQQDVLAGFGVHTGGAPAALLALFAACISR